MMDRTEDNKARTLAWLLDHQGIEYEVSSHDQD